MAGRLVRRPYVASAEPQTFRDNSVELCDDMGAAELSARPKATVIPEGTELDAVLAEVRRQASGRAARRLWLPPLDKYLSLETLQGRYGAYTPECKPWQLVLPIGELDDPGHQEKRPYAVSFEEDSNVAVYGASGSGRTELLATMLWSVLDESPDDRLAYVVDSEAGALLAFDGAPEVPNVLQVNDAERVSNLFKLMELEISKRQRLFGGEYTDLDAYNEKAPEGHHVPSILVAINGVAQFFELNPNLDERLSSIMRNGQRYGIHVLLAADAPNDIRFRLRSIISSSLVLMLASDDDYLAVLGSMRGVSLPKVRGRGLVRVGDEKLLFQTAFICEGGTSTYAEVKRRKAEQLERWGTPKHSVPVLPEVFTPEAAAGLSSDKTLAWGLLSDDLSTLQVSFAKPQAVLVAAGQSFQCVSFLQGAAEVAHAQGVAVVVIDPLGTLGQAPWWATSVPIDKARAAVEEAMGARVLLIVPDGKAALEVDGSEWVCGAIERPGSREDLIVLCGSSQNDLSRLQSKRWGQRLLSGEWIFWIGSGLTSAYALKVNTPSSQLKDTLGEGGGFAISRGDARPCKFVTVSEEQAW